MVGTTFGALVVLPATIKLTGVRLVRPEKNSPGLARPGIITSSKKIDPGPRPCKNMKNHSIRRSA